MFLKEKKIVAIPTDYWACGQYRIIQPYRDLALRYNKMSKYEFRLCLPQNHKRITLDMFKDYDVVVVQRVISQSQLDFIKQLKKMKKIVIQEIDDNLYDVATDNPFHKAMKGSNYKDIFRQSLKIVDFLHVTTQELKDIFVKLSKVDEKKVYVFPNAIDTSHPLIDENYNRRNEAPTDKIIFGWQGGSSHTSDLKYLNFIPEILDKYPNTMFAFCSHRKLFDDNFSHLMKTHKNRVIMIEPVQDTFDNFPNLPSLFDIGLAPLKDTRFNDCKSYLKCLEYGAWGIPTICSVNPDYQRFNEITNGLNVMVKNDKKEWVEAISKMIEDETYRKEMGMKVKQMVRNELALKEVNKMRFQFFMDLFNGKI